MWELDYKESWAPKNWCFWTVVLEKTLESLLDCKEIQSVHPKGYQSWVFIGGTDAEAETPILWPPHAKNWLIRKDPDAGKDWGQEEKGTTEDKMLGWHHWLNGHGFGWTTGVGDEWGGLACCGSWGHKESATTEWLNWTELMEAFSYRHGWSFISFLAPLSCLENRWGWKVQASNHGLVFLVTSPARGPPRVASLKATGYTVVTQEIPKDLSTLC